MVAKGKRGTESRRRKMDSRNSSTQAWGSWNSPLRLKTRSAGDAVYPRIVRNARKGEEPKPIWREGRRSGGAWQGQVPEWAIECEQCSLMFAYVRLCSLIGRKMFRAPRAASVARGQRCARPVLRTASAAHGHCVEWGTPGNRGEHKVDPGLCPTALELGESTALFSLSSDGGGGEGRGEESRFYWISPLPNPLPARSSQGEGDRRSTFQCLIQWQWGFALGYRLSGFQPLVSRASGVGLLV